MKTPITSRLCALALFIPLALRAVGPADPPSSVPGIINYQGRVTVGGVNFTGTGQFKFALVDGGVNQSQTATANAVMVAGQVTQIIVIGGGSGYTSAPVVTITGDGTGATATATLGLGMGTGTGPTDAVSSITITSAGSGYTGATVTIAPPPPNLVFTTYWSNDSTSIAGSEPAASVALGVNAGLYAVPLGDTALTNMQTIPASVFQKSDVRLRVWFDDGTHGSQLLTPDQRLVSAPYAMHAEKADSVDSAAITTVQLADAAVTAAKIAPAAITLFSLDYGHGSGASVTNGAAGEELPPGLPGQFLSLNEESNFLWVDSPGITLPYIRAAQSTGPVFGITNSDSGPAISGFGAGGDGVAGTTPQNGMSGVYGRTNAITNGQGVYGFAAAGGVGVVGVSQGNDGISGRTNADDKAGVFGYSNNTNSVGIKGDSVNGDGVVGITSKAGKSGVVGFASLSDNNAVAAINGAGTGLFAKTEGLIATAGFFWNSAGGDAIRTTGDARITGKVFASSDIVSTGAGNEQAYIGGDGNGDVEFGSKNTNVTLATFWNPTSNKLLDIKAHDATVRSLTITGGADLAEPFAIGDASELPKGTVVVIDANAPGQLKQSTHEYDTCVAGIVSGANGINPGISLKQEGVNEGGQQVALTGRVYCKADASYGAIKPGDLLTTSATSGHAMKATDSTRTQGAVLGKAMSALDEGTGFVLVLVTLQ